MAVGTPTFFTHPHTTSSRVKFDTTLSNTGDKHLHIPEPRAKIAHDKQVSPFDARTGSHTCLLQAVHALPTPSGPPSSPPLQARLRSYPTLPPHQGPSSKNAAEHARRRTSTRSGHMSIFQSIPHPLTLAVYKVSLTRFSPR